MRVLIVEDDLEACQAMATGLAEAGHECVTAPDGEAGLSAARAERFDVLIVDRMMPRTDGLSMVERLRGDADQTPVLFLSALGEINDRVAGLKAGGDDYLVKPYAFAELIARVEALARRRETGSVQTLLRVGDLEMDLIGRAVRSAGQSVTRTMLLEKVWEYHFDPQTNVIDVHISRLRSKIDKGFDKAMLQTCLLYTSDAADDLLCVDLGGRRIIK